VTTHIVDAAAGERQARVVELMLRAQDELVAGFEALEDAAAGDANGADLGAGRFGNHTWTRPTGAAGGDGGPGGEGRSGGGGRARVIEGGLVFERGGVNVSAVRGDRVPPTLAAQHPGTDGLPWFATGVSLVLHPRNPYVPAFHANFRFFEMEGGPGMWWFGGGADLTPSYPFADDVRHFHATLAGWCAHHPQADYAAWKATCDAYFTVRHRGEMRGVGGVFFDELTPPTADGHDFEADLACVADGAAALLPAYVPLVDRRRRTPFGDRERRWQAIRRGRYVEFNLVYDRGTLFGLQTGGHIEAILMSMPPVANWAFDHRPERGSPEDAALAYFQPRDWDVDPRLRTPRRTA
jgi:coproporphyrinogen III oxidase